MLEIDGSYGSGGGQILRTALGLSALTEKPFRLSGIRANRPNPGLARQHLTALKTVAELCNAEIGGAELHSTGITFKASKIIGQRLAVNIGTAGSITLLLQSMLPLALPAEIKLRAIGGSDVMWSPPANYTSNILFPALKGMGARFKMSLLNHGYYPKGQGKILFESKSSGMPLSPLRLAKRGTLKKISLFSHATSLPEHVPKNQASSAIKELDELGVDIAENITSLQTGPIGCGIDLIAEFSTGARLGANSLGKRGKPAQEVGNEAAKKLLEELSREGAIDEHLTDQLIPFMALAKGNSEITSTRISAHTLTNIWATEKFLDVKFEVEGGEGEPGKIKVKGAAFKY